MKRNAISRRSFLQSAGFAAGAIFAAHCLAKSRTNAAGRNNDLPNIVYILADDMGYGDLACQNPHSKIPTPNLDKLASEGIRLTDAHSPSAVCTPTRYAILTGQG